MKKYAILFLIFICLGKSLNAQTKSDISVENKVDKPVYFGIGFGFGFFYPSDVNDYIKDEMSYVYLTSGVEDLFLNIVGRISLTYRINRIIDLSWIAEYAWAPKYFSVSGGDNKYFHFDRISPGLIAKLHIPIGSGRHSIFLAPGILYHFMKFEEFKADDFGVRIEAGLSFNFGKSNLQPFICYDYAKAKDDLDFNNIRKFELNYSGAQIGVDFSF